MGNRLRIAVAHDFTCPWCWIGLFQAKRLKERFGAEIEWRGHELWPEELDWPESRPAATIPNKPSVPGRLDFLKMMDGVEVPAVERPKRMRAHAPLEAVEHFKEYAPDRVDELVESIYRAYWERGEKIGDIDVVARLAAPLLPSQESLEALTVSLQDRRHRDQVVHFDAPSYKEGIFNVPTFWIGGERYAEQPYLVLERAVLALPCPPESTPDAGDVYRSLSFPASPDDRPYAYINMVATVDGKIVTGDRDEPVVDLGSQIDHRLMKRIEAASDAVLLGAQTLRAAKKSWKPNAETRVVVSASGNLPYDSAFFSGRPIVAHPSGSGSIVLPNDARIETLAFDDLPSLLRTLRERGIERLLVLGGSSLNAQLFEKALIDEIFITIAPKIKLGKDVPTIADGNALRRDSIQNYSIVEQHRIGDELFVRYRRNT